jgi:feruloyl esterase
MYQGWDDPGIPPTETIDYYEAVHRRIGQEAASQVRLFMVPSMGHCVGGPGATSFDMQPVLERWVEHGEAPKQVIAVKPDSGEPPLTHPLCVWPKTAHYNGSGSTRDAANFSCK